MASLGAIAWHYSERAVSVMRKPRILLVEDTPDTPEFMQLLLESSGFVVVSREDGAEALSFLSQDKPDIILTDLMMPNVSGIELIEEVRSNSVLSNIPIIAMTAFSSGPIAKAMEAGANAIVKKPGGIETLVSTVRQLLPAGPV